MASDAYVTVPISDLQLNTENPRYEGIEPSQRDCIRKIAIQQGTKLVSLAKDIAANGFNPAKSVIVRRGKGRNQFVALDGNRRLAALKLLTSPGLLESLDLPAGLSNRIKKLYDVHKDSLDTQIRCVIQTVEEARHWMLVEHSGIKDGVATEDWDTPAKYRFRGKIPTLEILDLVCDSGYLDEKIKARRNELKLTNLERMIKSREAPRFGIRVVKGKVIYLEPEDVAIAKLSLLVSDLIETKKSVANIDNMEQRAEYAESVLQRPLPTVIIPAGSTSKPSAPTTATNSDPKPKKVNTTRSTLIPANCILSIQQPRINKIYSELQELKLDGYSNGIAVLLRVFIELSIDHYAKKHKVSLKLNPKPKACVKCGHLSTPEPRDLNLRQKISAVTADMVKQNLATAPEVAGLTKLATSDSYAHSVVSLNAYTHNKDLNPRPDELRTTWDDIQPTIEVLWSS